MRHIYSCNSTVRRSASATCRAVKRVRWPPGAPMRGVCALPPKNNTERDRRRLRTLLPPTKVSELDYRNLVSVSRTLYNAAAGIGGSNARG